MLHIAACLDYRSKQTQLLPAFSHPPTPFSFSPGFLLLPQGALSAYHKALPIFSLKAPFYSSAFSDYQDMIQFDILSIDQACPFCSLWPSCSLDPKVPCKSRGNLLCMEGVLHLWTTFSANRISFTTWRLPLRAEEKYSPWIKRHLWITLHVLKRWGWKLSWEHWNYLSNGKLVD